MNLLLRRPFILLTLLYCLSLVILDSRGFFSAPPKNDVSKFISTYPAETEGIIKSVLDPRPGRQRYIVRTLSVNGQKTGGYVLLTSFDPENRPETGAIVGFRARLSAPIRPKNPGEFDYTSYLSRKGVYTTAYTSSLTITGHKTQAFYKTIASAIRADMISAMHRYLPQKKASVLIPMIIGEKSELSEQNKQAFMDSGLMHILVVSGLNVGYVTIIFLGFFRLAGLKRRLAALCCIPFIVMFMLIVGDNPPVVRATVMALFIILSMSLSRDPLVYQSLALAAAAILIVDPQALFSASFQLSFAATIGIVYLYPFFMKPLQNLPRIVKNSIGTTIAVSLAAQLAVLPLLAYYFNRVSLIGLVSNIVVVPLAGIITALGILLYLLHFISYYAAAPVAYLTSVFLQAMLYFVNLFSTFPNASIPVKSPSFAIILCYYTLLAGIFHARKVPGKILAACALTAAAVFCALFLAPHKKELTLTCFYAGNGTAVYLRFPNGFNWLIDCGRERDGERVICPYLRSRGIRSIDKIIITSNDKRHSGGLKAVTDNFQVSEVVGPSAAAKQKQYFIGGSTVTIEPVKLKKENYLAMLLDFAGKRIVFAQESFDSAQDNKRTKRVELNRHPESYMPSADVLHLSGLKRKSDIESLISMLKPGAVILSGTPPKDMPEADNIYTLKKHGAVTASITSEGKLSIRGFKEDDSATDEDNEK